MVKILLAIWKYQNKGLFLSALLFPNLLVAGCSKQSNEVDLAEYKKSSVEKKEVDYAYICDFSKQLDYPINECTEVFLERLKSMPPEMKKFHRKDVAKFKTTKDIEHFWPAVKEYPEPTFLFKWMDVLNKGSNPKEDNDVVVGLDIMDNSKMSEYQAQSHAYQIITRMLEQAEKLTPEEALILTKSKSRGECLKNILKNLSDNPEKSMLNKDIVAKCYQP